MKFIGNIAHHELPKQTLKPFAQGYEETVITKQSPFPSITAIIWLIWRQTGGLSKCIVKIHTFSL